MMDPKSKADMFNMEETFNTLAENNKRSIAATLEFTRNNLNASLQAVKDVQEEQVRFTDAVFGQFTTFQKNYLKSVRDFTEEFYRYSDKALKDNQNFVEDVVDKSLELVKQGARKRTG